MSRLVSLNLSSKSLSEGTGRGIKIEAAPFSSGQLRGNLGSTWKCSEGQERDKRLAGGLQRDWKAREGDLLSHS